MGASTAREQVPFRMAIENVKLMRKRSHEHVPTRTDTEEEGKKSKVHMKRNTAGIKKVNTA